MDPLTTKILAKLGERALTDEEFRKKILMIILAVSLTFLLIIFVIGLIVTNPIAKLVSNFMVGDEYLSEIEEFKNEFDSVLKPMLGFNNGDYILPFNGDYTITDYFGIRLHPIENVWKQHKGLDFGLPWHCELLSIGNGVVVFASEIYSFGGRVVIQYLESYTDPTTSKEDERYIYASYSHLSKINVSEGDMVSTGDVIGLEGGDPNRDTPSSAGGSTGHHLHFEIFLSYYNGFPLNNDYIDPLEFLGIEDQKE